MRVCPNCGASKPKGSRFCGECDQELAGTRIDCPVCGAANRASITHCRECGAQLVPVGAAADEGDGREKQEPVDGVSLPGQPLKQGPRILDFIEAAEEDPLSDDWLTELRGSTDEAHDGVDRAIYNGEYEMPTDPGEPTDIPHWLQEAGPLSEEPNRGSKTEGSSPDEEYEGATEAEEGATAPETPESPTLRGLPRTPPALDVDSADSEAAPGELESSLVQLESPDGLPGGKGDIEKARLRSNEQEPTDREAEDWDDQAAAVEMDPVESSADSRGASTPGEEPLSEEPATKSDETPDWLLEAEREAGLLPEDPGTPAQTPPEEFALPEWLRDSMAEGRTAAEETFDLETETTLEESELRQEVQWADAPDWVHELGSGRDEDDEKPKGPVETEGLLEGLRGLLPAARGIEAPPTYGVGSVAGTSEASRARAKLLESLLGEPVSRPRRAAGDEGPDVERMVEGWNVAIVLLISVLGILLASLVTGRVLSLTRPVADPAAARLHEIVGSLDTADNVLIAFDYGPAEADELDRVAQPVLEHLMDLGPSISIVSTRPDGLPVAAALMTEIAESSDQYALLGYRPGAATAVSQLLAAADSPPSLLLVLTSRPGPLQRWVEQANARHGDELRVVAAGSALIEPVTTPYVDINAGQLSAAIHGLRGAAAYEALLGVRGGATERLDALAAGHIAIVGLIIAGAIKHGLGGPRAREH